MKIYVDENESPHFVEHINRIYGGLGTTLHTPQEEDLCGLEDMPLFEELRRRRFSALITRDRKQLRRFDPESGKTEAEKLHECGLHWIGHTTPAATGLDLIAELTSVYLENWTDIVELVETLPSPSSIHINRRPWVKPKAYPLSK
ncbi:hypothetical protein SEA_XAVIA_37 [Mycobacterium phage Xavia]|uniref:VapC45 PIN like domain-containing protein n=1 Tax=Mycobacterium phage Xavia TaxID=2178923 RepID=A0A2U8UHJ5_9CAUD|nr:hypothetical protein I5J51_gp37 [Mycobacterium phage Xavia]AWN02639.1 hypothetical protein SEA_XAVIA_37 [Mycobacterium phage Xavia]